MKEEIVQQLEKLRDEWTRLQNEDDQIADKFLTLELCQNSDYYRGRVNRMSHCIKDLNQIIEQAKITT